MFESLTDEQLLVQVRRTADQCVRVVSMSDVDRHSIGVKGNVSAEQGGTLSALFTLLALQECERRGID
jgi:hypothetical protein